jgi:hypothetical protein
MLWLLYRKYPDRTDSSHGCRNRGLLRIHLWDLNMLLRSLLESQYKSKTRVKTTIPEMPEPETYPQVLLPC